MTLRERKIYPKFKAQAKGGRLYYEDPAGLTNYLHGLNGKTLDVIVKPHHKDRSRQEEKYYHGVVVRMVAEAMGCEDQDAHELMRRMFLTVEESRTVDGKVGPKILRYERVLSTTELSDIAYREYWQNCVRWSALPTDPRGLDVNSGLELFIPYPNEVDFENW